MKCQNACGACIYQERCRPNSIKRITEYRRLCKEYADENTNGEFCIKYNPVFSNCKDLAVNIYIARHNLGGSASNALENNNAVNEVFEIFKELLSFSFLLE